MAKRLLSMFVLCIFSMVMIGTSKTFFSSGDKVQHDDGSHCQDSDENAPCDDRCPCLCCPGHFGALNTVATTFITTDTNTSNHEFAFPDDHHPSGVFRDIFRPPRA